MAKHHKGSHQKHRGILITKLIARDGINCGLCSCTLDRSLKDELSPDYITFDHLIPNSLGGSDYYANLQLAHRKCNEARGNKSLEQVT